MRHLLFALMIALLPLRGWVGEAMAGQMLAQQLSASKTVAGDSQAARATGIFSSEMMPEHAPDCPGHAQMAGNAADKAQPSAQTCSGCQMCSLLALNTAAPAATPSFMPHALPVARPATFASAEPAPGFKPPIS